MSEENHKIEKTRQKKKKLSDGLVLLETEIASLTQKKNEIKEAIDTDYHSFQDEVFGDDGIKKKIEDFQNKNLIIKSFSNKLYFYL
jgi:hypothetical protein